MWDVDLHVCNLSSIYSFFTHHTLSATHTLKCWLRCPSNPGGQSTCDDVGCTSGSLKNNIQLSLLERHSLVVLVVAVMLCGAKNCPKVSYVLTFYLYAEVLSVCEILILTDLAIVDGIEEHHRGGDDLEQRRNAGALRLHVLVLPTPPGTADRRGGRARRLVATRQPR